MLWHPLPDAMTGARILLVEDDEALAELLTWHLRREGHNVEHTADGEEALLLAAEGPPDIVLLDWMIEGLSGIEVCRRLRRATQTANVPIIMLTARGETDMKVKLLNMGADDYIQKPYSLEEVVARINAVLRRPEAALPTVLAVRDITLDPAKHTVTKGGKELSLTLKEFSLLEFFMRHPGEAMKREAVLDHVWSFDFPAFSNVLDVHMKNLRKKLDDYGDSDPLFETIRGIGYRLNA